MQRYSSALVAALHDAEPSLSVEEFRLPATRGDARGSALGRQRVRFVEYPRRARPTRFDVNHVVDQGYAHLSRVLEPRRTVVTCHDIFPILHWRQAIPGLARRSRPPLTFKFSLRSLQSVRYVIAPSASTMQDLIMRIGLEPERIRVIPYGVGDEFIANGVRPICAPLRQRLTANSQDARLILAVDTGAAYKNTQATLHVLARVCASGSPVRLIRVGPPLDDAGRSLATELGVGDRIVELGPVPPESMPDVYRACHVLLFPSWYEGFGWPPLEAMAVGLPVVCSTWRSLDEVVGEAALRAEPDDHDKFAEHVLSVLDDAAMTANLIRRGLARARPFTWRRAAEATAAVYRSILEEVA